MKHVVEGGSAGHRKKKGEGGRSWRRERWRRNQGPKLTTRSAGWLRAEGGKFWRDRRRGGGGWFAAVGFLVRLE